MLMHTRSSFAIFIIFITVSFYFAVMVTGIYEI